MLLADPVCLQHYMADFGMVTRVARFHNIYGPQGTWCGGREKAPAAMCRKVLANSKSIEIWGDGMQTRSFCYIDACVEGVLRLFHSDVNEPINIGSDEMISMNDLVDLACSFEDKKLEKIHVPGPEGVRGRNSDNTLIKEKLGWAPDVALKDGLRSTYFWIKGELEKEAAKGVNIEEAYGKSKVMKAANPDEMSDQQKLRGDGDKGDQKKGDKKKDGKKKDDKKKGDKKKDGKKKDDKKKDDKKDDKKKGDKKKDDKKKDGKKKDDKKKDDKKKDDKKKSK